MGASRPTSVAGSRLNGARIGEIAGMNVDLDVDVDLDLDVDHSIRGKQQQFRS